MMDRDPALRGSRRSPGLLKFAMAVAGLCVVAGCGGPGTKQAATSPGSGVRTSARATAKAVAKAAAAPAALTSASVVQCDTTGTGGTLPAVASKVTLPAGVTVPDGDVVYGTHLTIASGALFLIGHPEETSSQDCYPGTGTLTDEASLQILPDNGLYSQGEMVVPAGSSTHPFGGQCRPGAGAAADLNTSSCADVSDGADVTSIATGTSQVSVFMFTVPTAPASGRYLEGTLAADTSKPVVELYVDNQTTGAGQAEGFSGAIACSMDSAADCAASLPYFLAQAAAGSPMTAADYSGAFTQIESAVDSGSAAGTASAPPTASAGSSTGTAAADSGSECAAIEKTYASFLAGTITGTGDNYWMYLWGDLPAMSGDTGLAGAVGDLSYDADTVGSDIEDSNIDLPGTLSYDEELIDDDVKAVAADCGTTLADPPASDYESGSW